MPDDDARDGGRGRGGRDGRGGGDGGRKREDSPFEVALALVIERLTRVFGAQAVGFIPKVLLDEAKKLAGQRQIGPAVRTLGRLTSIFGDDEEIRGAILGFSQGIAEGIDRADEGTVVERMKTLLQDDGGLKKLESLQKAGRLEEQRLLPIEEAFTYLDDTQLAAIASLVSQLADKGGYLSTRFSPRGLQGIADMLIMRRNEPIETLAEEFRKRFSPPPTGPGKSASDIIKVIETLKKQFAEATKLKPGELPFETRVRAGTNRIAAGFNAFERAFDAPVRRPRWTLLGWIRQRWRAFLEGRERAAAERQRQRDALNRPPVP